MKAALLLALALVPAVAAAAPPEKISSLKLKDGTELRQAKVIASENESLRIEHADGISRVAAENLPADLQERYGLDAKTLAEVRDVREKAEQDQRAAERRARVASIMEAGKDKQDADFQSQRTQLFRIVEGGNYSYAELDNMLLTSISVLNDAGRQDLAEVLADDRKMLRERESRRPGEKEKAEKETMLTRIKELEEKLAKKPEQQVVVVQQPAPAPAAAPNPETIIVDRPVFLPQTVVVPSVPRPPVTRPVPPARPAPASSAAERMVGSHQWKR